MKKTIICLILSLTSIGAKAQDKMIRVTDESNAWRKNIPQVIMYDGEKERLLMPQGAAFGVECVPSFSPEWTLTYDSVSHKLVYKEAQTSIWRTTYRATHKMKRVGKRRYKRVACKRPKNYVAPDVKTFVLTISNEQVSKLRAALKTAIDDAEDRGSNTMDGVSWEFFVEGCRAKSHRENNALVVFTEKLRTAVRNGDTNRRDSLISTL